MKFLWGSATASYQCEGAWNIDGKLESNWDHYLHENNLENGDIASDFYNRFAEDIKLLKEGGQNVFRFSISWPRIIKDESNTVNQKGLDFYHRIIDECLKNDVEPFITIYHWDHPLFIEKKGGWLNRDTAYAFLEYSKIILNEFSDKVKYWVTINEPRYFSFSGYKIGNYPPGLNDMQKTIDASYHIMLGNALTVEYFKKHINKGQIGIVHSYSPVFGVDDSIETKQAIRNADLFFNDWVLSTAALGVIPQDLIEKVSDKYSLEVIKDGDLELFKNNTVDFLGLNYYDRALVKPYTEGETILTVNNAGSAAQGSTKVVVKDWFEQVFEKSSKYTKWDAEIYPDGLYEGILMAYERYKLPIFITENGIGEYENITNEMYDDSSRIEFLRDHILAMLKAMDEGADVRGYFVWSTMDLYSWKNGHEKRYGLIGVNYEDNLKRVPKKSYYWYKDVCLINGENIKNPVFNKLK